MPLIEFWCPCDLSLPFHLVQLEQELLQRYRQRLQRFAQYKAPRAIHGDIAKPPTIDSFRSTHTTRMQFDIGIVQVRAYADLVMVINASRGENLTGASKQTGEFILG